MLILIDWYFRIHLTNIITVFKRLLLLHKFLLSIVYCFNKSNSNFNGVLSISAMKC